MTVVLSGREGGTTHHEVQLLGTLPGELRLIGGLAVMCRVGTPHRATIDLDAVARGLPDLHPRLARLALTASGGGQYGFPDGLDLDVIDVAPTSAADVLDELVREGSVLSDLELNVVAHTWAHDHATPLDIVAVDDRSGLRLATAPDRMVASTGGLLAMKVTTVPLRASSRPEKRSSDLYDLGRLLLDGEPAPGSFGAMPGPLRAAIVDRLSAWFVDEAGRDRTYREVRRFDEPRLDLDQVADAVEDLLG